MRALWIVVLACGLVGPLYAYAMAVIGARTALRRPEAADRPFVVCIVPCLNEGTVVARTVAQLVSLGTRVRVVVVDDGSDDGSDTVLGKLESDRVLLLRRMLPNARQGKGAALNHALAEIAAAAREDGVDPDNVVVAVVDGDGRIDQDTLDAVLPWFSEPDVGGVQIAVRIENRYDSRLARMQDLEFVAFGDIFGPARNRIGSTGLGGNGQFVRLSALLSVGEEPWTDALTEDLDLGIRLRLAGWRNIYEGSVTVHQQGLHSTTRLLRQRTRWFQGHLQAWDLIPSIWRSGLPLRSKADLTAHLFLPVMLMLVSVGVIASLLGAFRWLTASPDDAVPALGAGPLIPWWYLLGFLATPLIAFTYWRREGVPFFRGLLLAHLYAVFTWIWFIAGWRACVRQISGARSWVKTERVVLEGASLTSPATNDGLRYRSADVSDDRRERPIEHSSAGSTAR